MLQNVEIPKRFGDSNTDIMAAKSLPIEAPRGGTEHQIQLAEIHLGEAALQYQSRPSTSLSTVYRHRVKEQKNRVTKVYSSRRFGKAKYMLEQDIVSGRVTGFALVLMGHMRSGLRPVLNKIFHQSLMPFALFAVQMSLKLWIARPG